MMDIQKLIQDAERADAVAALMQDVNPRHVLELAEKLKEAEAKLAELAKQENNDSLAIKESQFLSDVITAAGLVEHGKRDKALAERLSAYCVYRRSATAPPAPVKLPSLKQTISGERYVWSDGVYNYQQDVIEILKAAGVVVEVADE